MLRVTDAEHTQPLDEDALAAVDAYWRACNYLAVGQIYLLDNPLLQVPLTPQHVKPRLLGHWGTTPGLNLVYAHCNRVIRERDLDMIYVIGPGHGGPAIAANAWLEGSYTDHYPDVRRDAAGMQRLFRQFSFPGGIPSHVAPEIPGSIHEGGELGYSLAHAVGAAFDNPDLVVTCVVGDGEAETGALAASWQSTTFLDPARDGAVLPILHLNGYKIAGPTILARIGDAALTDLLTGCGWKPYLVEGDEPRAVHQALAGTLDVVLDEIRELQRDARAGAAAGRRGGEGSDGDGGDDGAGSGGAGGGYTRRPWPMIVLRTPKGWTGPDVVDGVQVEGTWRAHQVPLESVRDNPSHLELLEQWLRGYHPEELFGADGVPSEQLCAWAPSGTRRMGSNPHANGGRLTLALDLPDFRDHGVAIAGHGRTTSEATRVLGTFLTEVLRRNGTTFRLFGPDETASNRLDAVYEVTANTWNAEIRPVDEHLAPDGRVLEVLSEHLCQGWLEGYLLTGRHGLFSCYEAFVHVVDSMFNQHAKWLNTAQEIGWREPIPSLNYLLTSHVWRQDHNGFSHQDPGFIDHVVNKKAQVVRVYLPPDANCLLSVADHCLRSRDYVNVIVAGKQPAPTWLAIDDAADHCARGIGVWDWASTDAGAPQVVLGCAGDVPTLEVLAAADLLRQRLPEVRVRVVNVVDLMRLQPPSEHPHGLPDPEYDALFPPDVPVVFAYHGYPWLIHRLSYRRHNHDHLHVRGYKEEGTTTTPFDMVVVNDLDRYHLVMDVIDRVPGLATSATVVRQDMVDARAAHRRYVLEHGEDLPEVRDWMWPEG